MELIIATLIKEVGINSIWGLILCCFAAWYIFLYKRRNGTADKAHKKLDGKLDRVFDVVDSIKKEVGEIKTQLAVGKEKMEAMNDRLDHHRDEISDLNKRGKK